MMNNNNEPYSTHVDVVNKKKEVNEMFKPDNEKAKELAFFMRLKNMMSDRLELEENDYMINLIDKDSARILSIAKSYDYIFFFYSDDFYDYSLNQKEFQKKLYDF